MTTEFPSLDEFMRMKDDEVAELVSFSPYGRVGVLAPDGNRRAGIILWGLDPSKDGFDKEVSSILQSKFLNVIRCFITNGVRTLFIPIMGYGNFERGKTYMNVSIRFGLDYIFHDPAWLSFYEETNIRVRFYGNREFMKNEGYSLLVDWMQELEERTAANDGANLFIGFAHNRSRDEIRLISMSIDFYKKWGRAPTRDELIRLYFGTDVPDVGFFVRSCEVRDSDCQPILISGLKTQFYFPVVSLTLLSEKAIRCILYDVIANREGPGGKKMYSRTEIEATNITRVREYYELNCNSVLGLGLREGSFWLPYAKIEVPPSMHYTIQCIDEGSEAIPKMTGQ